MNRPTRYRLSARTRLTMILLLAVTAAVVVVSLIVWRTTRSSLVVAVENNLLTVNNDRTQQITDLINTIQNQIATLTVNEVTQIFSAEQWSDVNPSWPQVPINRYIPDQQSGTFDWFVQTVYDGDPTALNVAPRDLPASRKSSLHL